MIRVLLLAFSFSLIGPALLASSGNSDTPACCRRDGKHQCSMKASAVTDHLVLRGLRTDCPHCPNGSQTPAGTKLDASAPVFVELSADLIESLDARVADAETAYRIADQRASQKRGPPAFFL